MNSSIYFQLALFLIVLFACAWPLGGYINDVMSGESKTINRLFGPAERLLYRVCGVDPNSEMSWKQQTTKLSPVKSVNPTCARS